MYGSMYGSTLAAAAMKFNPDVLIVLIKIVNDNDVTYWLPESEPHEPMYLDVMGDDITITSVGHKRIEVESPLQFPDIYILDEKQHG